ncbi:hypothetical protein LJC48_07565, partial [Desulfovibrio sp. OttesenSCG-928-C06]|nr:hypothetical protein [Desulfovibrio sp. OttesenSCG-928-C06]
MQQSNKPINFIFCNRERFAGFEPEVAPAAGAATGADAQGHASAGARAGIRAASRATVRAVSGAVCLPTIRLTIQAALRTPVLGILLALAFFLSNPLPAVADDEIIPPTLQGQQKANGQPRQADPGTQAEQDAAQSADAEDNGKLLNTGLDFFDQADIGGGLYYFQRKRTRYNVNSDEWRTNLDHATVQAAAHFDSGWAGDGFLKIGVDFGVFGSTDLRQKGSIDHEMNFVPWRSPWKPDWNDSTVGGVSVYKANLKLQAGPEQRRGWLRAGYFQPSGPGVLGVNWSIMPGTYQGIEGGLSFGQARSQSATRQDGSAALSAGIDGSDGGNGLGGATGQMQPDLREQGLPGRLELAAALVNAYKAPWYRDFYTFRKADKDTRIDYMWSLGARYSLESGEEGDLRALTLEAAYGGAQDYLHNFHLKAGYGFDLGPGRLDLKYHFYGMLDNDSSGSVNDNFDGLAYQHYLGAFYSLGLWNFRAEYTYTRVPQSEDNHIGYFAYRMTNPTGSSKGAYDIWWDARSDWDHDQEMAAFLGISRGLDDLLPFNGLRLGLGGAIGWDGQARGYAQHLKEYAWTADIIYVHPDGPLKGASASLHFTRYYNRTDLSDWTGYRN